MPTIVARLGGLELYSWVFRLHADFGADDAALRQVSGSVQPPASDAHRHRHFCARIDIVRRGSKHGDAGSFSRDSRFGRRRDLRLGLHRGRCSVSSGTARQDAGHHQQHLGISSILGPLAGGLIVEYQLALGLFVNLPITAVSIGLIIVGLKEESRTARALDLPGAATLPRVCC